MSLEGLLAVAGVMLAIYAIAQPVQRRSIFLLVPTWLVPCSLLLSAIIVFWREGTLAYGYCLYPWADFLSTMFAFLLPVVGTLWAVNCWWKATLTSRKDARFRQFILTCLREGKFDELMRILERNANRLTKVCEPDTADLLFEDRLIQAMIRARSWVHLRLLASDSLLDLLPSRDRAVGRTLRALLFADNSPLRTSALLDEGGDETLHCTDEEDLLINRTFRKPQWYHRCRAGYPVLIAACEKIDSGSLDVPYNRADRRYGARQGVATRAVCPVFLVEKTIAHALQASLEEGDASSEDIHRDAADLWDLFRTVYDHSKYRPETWDEPFGYGDDPTPFGFLLSEILGDYEHICYEAWRRSDYGEKPPAEIVAPVARMWAYCIMLMVKDEGKVSRDFRLGRARSYLDLTLERRHAEVSATSGNESRAAWTQVFLEALKEASGSWGREKSKDFLTEAANGLDICKDYVSKNHQWLRDELELRPRPKPQR